MFSFSRALVAGAVLIASASATSDNFILSQVRTLSVTRVDPLVNPGANGRHVHLVMGASNFGPNSGSPDTLHSANCSSTLVGDDKSSYWTPQLYYNMGNGSYTPMIGETRIYYFLKALNGTTPVVAFPRGFRMVAGGPSESRPATYPPRGDLTDDQLQAMDPRIAAIKWGCSAGAVQGQGNGGSLPGQRPYLPNDAPNGCGVVNAGIFFPSCGDGRLDSDDHFSHMAYPLDGSNGYNCPTSHSIKYPTIFVENFYFPKPTQSYRGANQDNFVLSNGDTLGLTMHADFINGWMPGVLEAVLAQCNAPNSPGQDLTTCAPLAQSLSVDNANNCRSEGDIVYEDVGLLAPINALPGCNPIWPVDARTKPTCDGPQLPMGPPTGRLDIPDLSIALPLANASSQTVAAPTSTSTSTLATSTSATTTSAMTTTTTTTSAVTSTSAATTSTSAATTSTSAATTPYPAVALAYSTSSSPPSSPAGSESTSSASSTQSSSPSVTYAVAASASSTTATESCGAPATTGSVYVYGMPYHEPGHFNPCHSAPPTSSVSSWTSVTPMPQNAGVSPKKTCRKNKSNHHARRRRDWHKQLLD